MIDTENELIYSKTIDKSLITEGFTLPLGILEDFFQWFPSLEIGQKQEIKLKLDGAFYPVHVINQPFNRAKYPDHSEIYQVRYTNVTGFPQALQKIFNHSSNYLLSEHAKMREAKKNGGKQKQIILPDEYKETFSIYRTDDPLVWEVVPLLNTTNIQTINEIKTSGFCEEDIEIFLRHDRYAGIVEKLGLKKVRKLDVDIGRQLKKLYSNRCQICGQQVAEQYGGIVSESHHIIPFSESLNNDSTNLIIVCPNHHRIIHKCNPKFLPKKKEFVYPNGLHEPLILNKHL